MPGSWTVRTHEKISQRLPSTQRGPLAATKEEQSRPPDSLILGGTRAKINAKVRRRKGLGRTAPLLNPATADSVRSRHKENSPHEQARFRLGNNAVLNPVFRMSGSSCCLFPSCLSTLRVQPGSLQLCPRPRPTGYLPSRSASVGRSPKPKGRQRARRACLPSPAPTWRRSRRVGHRAPPEGRSRRSRGPAKRAAWAPADARHS